MIAMLPAFAEVSAAETLSANDITAEAAVLIDSETGDILFEKDSSKKLGMASTTKIMTGILAIENCRLDDIVTISRHASYTEGSSIYTKEGEKISVETLIYGLLLKSSISMERCAATSGGRPSIFRCGSSSRPSR